MGSISQDGLFLFIWSFYYILLFGLSRVYQLEKKIAPQISVNQHKFSVIWVKMWSQSWARLCKSDQSTPRPSWWCRKTEFWLLSLKYIISNYVFFPEYILILSLSSLSHKGQTGMNAVVHIKSILIFVRHLIQILMVHFQCYTFYFKLLYCYITYIAPVKSLSCAKNYPWSNPGLYPVLNSAFTATTSLDFVPECLSVKLNL